MLYDSTSGLNYEKYIGIAIQAKGKFFITYRSCISLESAHSETLWGKKKKSQACLDFGRINERGL